MNSVVTKLNVDMHINDLAFFMFLKNVNNAIIELSLGGIQNNKDLFFFCLDLFCKGLVHLFGQNGKIHVDQITQEQFEMVKNKMALAGINVILKIIQLQPNTYIEEDSDDDSPPDLPSGQPQPNQMVGLNIHEIESEELNKPMKDYVFKIKMHNINYNINFELVHRVH